MSSWNGGLGREQMQCVSSLVLFVCVAWLQASLHAKGPVAHLRPCLGMVPLRTCVLAGVFQGPLACKWSRCAHASLLGNGPLRTCVIAWEWSRCFHVMLAHTGPCISFCPCIVCVHACLLAAAHAHLNAHARMLALARLFSRLCASWPAHACAPNQISEKQNTQKAT